MYKAKVIHVTQSLGGVRTYIEHVFNHSDREKVDYVIIAPEHSEFQEFCKRRNIKYYPIKIGRSINPFKDVSALINLIKIFRREMPDVIHTHSAKGGYLGRIAGRFVNGKVIYSPHAFSYLSFKGVKRMIFYGLEYAIRGWTDLLLCVSHSEANRAIYELGFAQSKIKTILNSVPVQECQPFRNYSRCDKIGMIGRLTYQKNPLLFLEIAASLLQKYPNVKFSILGAGMCDHLASEIAEFIKSRNLTESISILPWGDGDTSKLFLENIDVFALTSVFEGLPFSLIEAMSMGIPCVVSKSDGNVDVIHNYENGFACISETEFTRKIALLIENYDVRYKIGQAGYRYIKEKHDIENSTSELVDLYQKMAGKENLIPFNNLNRSKEIKIEFAIKPNAG